MTGGWARPAREIANTPPPTRTDEFYWRGRVVETLLDAGHAADVHLAVQRPGESVAIPRSWRKDLLPLLRELTEAHPMILTS